VTPLARFQRRSDLGRDGRLRVAPERETPLHQSPQARTPLYHIEKDRSIVAGPASGFRCVKAFPYSSRDPHVGMGTVTDKNYLPESPQISARALSNEFAATNRYDDPYGT
jgi:hypothetical protein